MESLLRNKYTEYYGQPSCIKGAISRNTNSAYFELNDDTTIIYHQKGNGVAKFNNPSQKTVTAINYESFVGLLSPKFRNGRGVCDIITISDNKEYFLLNELSDTQMKYILPYVNTNGPQIGKRRKAKSQLINSLNDLLNVPDIASYISLYRIRRCCFFNKKGTSPSAINATSAFGRLNKLNTEGFKMSNSIIESNGFEYYEYFGEQTCNL